MLNKTRIFSALGTATVLLLTGASQAAAQDQDDVIVVKREERGGLALGVELGGGHMECEGVGCDGVTEAGGLSVNAGVLLTPNFGIMADGWMMGHREDRLTLTHGMATIGPQLWIGPFWVRGGVGVARASFNYDAGIVDIGDKTETVPAAMAALGLEVISTPDFALDVRLRGGTGFFNDGDTEVRNLSLGLGANWY
ncbi:MAG TPA: outer membrane beta-barrel protein [Haliangium sp.]|nr:outer membrane beta-barrel protein [Haliangium sp.]